MSNSQNARLQFEAGRSQVPFDPAVMPESARSWQLVFDVLAPCQLADISGAGAIQTCQIALDGGLTSLSLSSSVSLPKNSSVRYSYSFVGHGAAQLRLSGRSRKGLFAGMERFDINIPDPECIFLRYLAQRLSRAQRATCELCGQELREQEISAADRLLARRHQLKCHPECHPYRAFPPSGTGTTANSP